MIILTTVGGVNFEFPDYIFSTQRVRFSNGNTVYIDGNQFVISSLRTVNGEESSSNAQPQISDLPFNGNRVTKRSGIPNINTGENTILGFVEKYFFPFNPAILAMVGESLTIEFGVKKNIYLKAKLIPNDEIQYSNLRIVETTNDNKVVFLNDSQEVDGYLDVIGNESLTSQNKMRTFMALADVNNNGNPITLKSPMYSVNFFLPTFWGMHEKKVLSSSDVFSLSTKKIDSNVEKWFNPVFNGEDKYIHFLSPYNSNLIGIKDKNGFDVTSSFEKTELVVTTPNLFPQWSKTYYSWSSMSKVDVNNATFTFMFK